MSSYVKSPICIKITVKTRIAYVNMKGPMTTNSNSGVMFHVRDTLSYWGKHLYPVIWKSLNRQFFSKHSPDKTSICKTQGQITLLKMKAELWFMYAAHRLIIVKICVKIFENPTVHVAVTGKESGSDGQTNGQSNFYPPLYEVG